MAKRATSAPRKPAAGKTAASKRRPAAPKAKKAKAEAKKAKPKAKTAKAGPAMMLGHAALLPVLRSIRSVIYKVTDLPIAKQFYAAALGRQPYFDEPFYVGFDVDGQELGLDPDVSTRGPGPGGGIAFWKVSDIHAVWARLTEELGGTPDTAPHGVGGDILMATVGDPSGNLVGLIQIDS